MNNKIFKTNDNTTSNGLRYNKATFWKNKKIKNISRNEVYIGNTVQNKRSRISYKNRYTVKGFKCDKNLTEIDGYK